MVHCLHVLYNTYIPPLVNLPVYILIFQTSYLQQMKLDPSMLHCFCLCFSHWEMSCVFILFCYHILIVLIVLAYCCVCLSVYVSCFGAGSKSNGYYLSCTRGHDELPLIQVRDCRRFNGYTEVGLV